MPLTGCRACAGRVRARPAPSSRPCRWGQRAAGDARHAARRGLLRRWPVQCRPSITDGRCRLLRPPSHRARRQRSRRPDAPASRCPSACPCARRRAARRRAARWAAASPCVSLPSRRQTRASSPRWWAASAAWRCRSRATGTRPPARGPHSCGARQRRRPGCLRHWRRQPDRSMNRPATAAGRSARSRRAYGLRGMRCGSRRHRSSAQRARTAIRAALRAPAAPWRAVLRRPDVGMQRPAARQARSARRWLPMPTPSRARRSPIEWPDRSAATPRTCRRRPARPQSPSAPAVPRASLRRSAGRCWRRHCRLPC
jgi:hypothetical protein